MTSWVRRVLALGCAVAGPGASGCSDNVRAQETVDRAVAFMEAHQSCETDADCAVVSDFCETLPGGFCGQLTMSRAGEESAEWRSITAELEECSPEKCAQCLAALVPVCFEGSCGGPSANRD